MSHRIFVSIHSIAFLEFQIKIVFHIFKLSFCFCELLKLLLTLILCLTDSSQIKSIQYAFLCGSLIRQSEVVYWRTSTVLYWVWNKKKMVWNVGKQQRDGKRLIIYYISFEMSECMEGQSEGKKCQLPVSITWAWISDTQFDVRRWTICR